MNSLPINKIFLAGFAFALTHWKKIIEISILPVLISSPFLMVVPELLGLMEQVFNGGKLIEVVLPEKIQQISATKIRDKMRKDGKLK